MSEKINKNRRNAYSASRYREILLKDYNLFYKNDAEEEYIHLSENGLIFFADEKGVIYTGHSKGIPLKWYFSYLQNKDKKGVHITAEQREILLKHCPWLTEYDNDTALILKPRLFSLLLYTLENGFENIAEKIIYLYSLSKKDIEALMSEENGIIVKSAEVSHKRLSDNKFILNVNGVACRHHGAVYSPGDNYYLFCGLKHFICDKSKVKLSAACEDFEKNGNSPGSAATVTETKKYIKVKSIFSEAEKNITAIRKASENGGFKKYVEGDLQEYARYNCSCVLDDGNIIVFRQWGYKDTFAREVTADGDYIDLKGFASFEEYMVSKGFFARDIEDEHGICWDYRLRNTEPLFRMQYVFWD